MTRPWHVWAAFSLCLLVVLAAVAWLGRKTLELDRAQREARELAVLEGNVRLALWYLESAAIPLLARENARQHFVYAPFYPSFHELGANPDGEVGQGIQTRAGKGAEEGAGMGARKGSPTGRGGGRPSPLLMAETEDVLLHFQIGPSGELSSPQVPGGMDLERAVGLVPEARLSEGAKRLAVISRILAGTDLRERILLEEAQAAERLRIAQQIRVQQARSERQAAAQPSAQEAERSQQVFQIDLAQVPDPLSQQSVVQGGLNRNDLGFRFDNNAFLAGNIAEAKLPVFDDVTGEGLMHPFWVDGELLLARRVAIAGRSHVQGCWLDWKALEARFLARVRDLLPEAGLVQAQEGSLEGDEGVRVLAALPIQLVPGKVDLPGDGSPLGLWLVLAWASVAIAAVAVAALLRGAVSLSERRAAFVSAVTHELRTPLTTFRMYAEMLSSDMVRDEGKRRRYLETLGREAIRLGHLVENVLAYARLERGRGSTRIEPILLADLLARARERLEDRARQAGLRLELGGNGPFGELTVLADPGAVEQILFNLVDNACKYAAAQEDPTSRGLPASESPASGGPPSAGPQVAIDAEDLGGKVAVRVRDRGPGIPASLRPRLFRPFSKSASEAASSVPGVGLGLALSRRLARQMGGDLRLDASAGEGPPPQRGACFLLTLRKVERGTTRCVTRTEGPRRGPCDPPGTPAPGSRGDSRAPSAR
jgi:signal transduction histidine kinase